MKIFNPVPPRLEQKGILRFGFPEGLVLGLAAFLLFFHLGSGELNSADEAIHAQVAREMTSQENWFHPTYRGEPYWEKPPLKLWLTALTFKFLGISEWTARLWSALFGLGTILGIMRLGTFMFNRTTGILSGLVLITTWEFLFNHCSRTGEMDSALIFFTTWTVLELWRFRTTEDSRCLYKATLWMSLGFLTKGHLALVPLLWIPWIWNRKEHGPAWEPRTLLRTLLLFIGITAPWFIQQSLYYGKDFLDYNLHHNVMGYMSGKVEQAETSLVYFFEQIIWLNYPWPPFVIMGFMVLFWKKKSVLQPPSHLAGNWLIAWIIAQILILALNKTKLPWYHLPLFVPFSILSALALERIWKSTEEARTLRWNLTWNILHLGLLFCLTGFALNLISFLKAWFTNQTQEFSNYTHYLFKDPPQRSALIGFILFPLVFAGLFLARKTRISPSILIRKLQVLGLLLGSSLFILIHIQREPHTEHAQSTIEEKILKPFREYRCLNLYLLDPPSPVAPHFGVTPSLFYYLSLQTNVQMISRHTFESDWKSLVQNAPRPWMAMIPSHFFNLHTEWFKDAIPLEEIQNSKVVYLPKLDYIKGTPPMEFPRPFQPFPSTGVEHD